MTEQMVLKQVDVKLLIAPDMELEACEQACAVAENMDMSPERVDEVRMAVVEAVINAIEHSGSEDGEIHLHIAVLGGSEPETLRITVQDHGVGFDPSKLVKPNIEHKISAKNKRGWGFEIIEGLMDSVVVHSNQQGTSVVMSKYKEAAAD